MSRSRGWTVATAMTFDEGDVALARVLLSLADQDGGGVDPFFRELAKADLPQDQSGRYVVEVPDHVRHRSVPAPPGVEP